MWEDEQEPGESNSTPVPYSHQQLKPKGRNDVPGDGVVVVAVKSALRGWENISCLRGDVVGIPGGKNGRNMRAVLPSHSVPAVVVHMGNVEIVT